MIPQIQPWIDETELNELKRVVDSTYVTEHNLTKEFEDLTQKLTGSKHVQAFCNGTLAIFSALKALGIGPGDEVIVPNLTFIATSNAVVLTGASPVFCEIKEDTFCIDVEKAAHLVNKNTKAILPVHLYGQSADMEAVLDFAKAHNIYVVEDAAQGVGVKFNDKHVGTFGNLGILSYYGNKTITTGEGGVILTDDDNLALETYRLKNHGRDKKGLFVHDFIGYNFSFTEMQAAIGLGQMKKLERIVEKKQQIYDIYIKELSNMERFRPVFIDPRCKPVFWFTSFVSDDVDTLAQYLSDNGIQTRRFFYPLHQQKCYSGLYNSSSPFPVSEKVFKTGISLPSSYQLTDDEQALVIEKIREFYKK